MMVSPLCPMYGSERVTVVDVLLLKVNSVTCVHTRNSFSMFFCNFCLISFSL